MPDDRFGIDAPGFEYRALVVDDDPRWRRTLMSWLVELGLNPDGAQDLQSADLALDQRFYQVAILDLVLDPTDTTNRDGLLLAKKLYHLREGTAFILLTGYGTMSVGREATLYGAMDAIGKEELEHASFLAEVELGSREADRILRNSVPAMHLASEAAQPEGLALLYPALSHAEACAQLDDMWRTLAYGFHPTLPLRKGAEIPVSSSKAPVNVWFWSKTMGIPVEAVFWPATAAGCWSRAMHHRVVLRAGESDDVWAALLAAPRLSFAAFQRPRPLWRESWG